MAIVAHNGTDNLNYVHIDNKHIKKKQKRTSPLPNVLYINRMNPCTLIHQLLMNYP